MSIERSAGLPVQAGGVVYGMAGGGYCGITASLDQVVQQAAETLAAACAADVEIRLTPTGNPAARF